MSKATKHRSAKQDAPSDSIGIAVDITTTLRAPDEYVWQGQPGYFEGARQRREQRAIAAELDAFAADHGFVVDSDLPDEEKRAAIAEVEGLPMPLLRYTLPMTPEQKAARRESLAKYFDSGAVVLPDIPDKAPE